MSNPIKYSTGSESLALKTGNFYIGTGDVGKGPTSTTGYYNGITPPSGGYTVYLNKASGGPSIYAVANDAELISLTNQIAGTSYTTVNECLVYFAGQTDKMVLNRDYEGIVTDGLILNLDAGFTPSYPKSGTTWYDLSGNGRNGTLTNGPTFNSGNGGSIVFDGSNEYVNINNSSSLNITDNISVETWFYSRSYRNPEAYAINFFKKYGNTSNANFIFYYAGRYLSNRLRVLGNANGIWRGVSPTSQVLNLNEWYHVIWTYSNGGLLYINGVSQGPKEAGGLLAVNNNSIDFGVDLNGNISNVKIYNKALSAVEVLQNFNAQKSRFGL